jgi:hypothetical protein
MKGLLPFLLVFTSCTPTATLFTDTVFRAAAPEVVKAWEGLRPLHDARSAELPQDAAKALREALPHVKTALIGAALTSDERTALTADFPQVRLVFFVPASEAEGQAVVTVDRDLAWAVVARRAAEKLSPAIAIFPTDVTPDELDQFSRVWTNSGGGTLTEMVWPVTAVPGSDPLFQWAGRPAEGLVKTLSPGRVVHTDPGIDRPPHSTGLTWKIRIEGLGDKLWQAATDSAKIPYQLPLEAVVNNGS